MLVAVNEVTICRNNIYIHNITSTSCLVRGILWLDMLPSKPSKLDSRYVCVASVSHYIVNPFIFQPWKSIVPPRPRSY